MSRKHFQKLADALRANRPAMPGGGGFYTFSEEQWGDIVGRVADVCAVTNANFDRARFVAACKGDK